MKAPHWLIPTVLASFGVCGLISCSEKSSPAGSHSLTPPSAAQSSFDHFLFGVCYYPEQWPKNQWEPDARRMQEAGVNTVRLGEFAWSRLEPDEGRFDFGWLDEAIAILARYDIKVILGTPTATPPKWLTSRYPEVLHVEESGQPADTQSRRHYCYSSPRYRQLCSRVVTALADRYGRNPNVIGWQVDNEMNNENKACFSSSCRDGFRGWLKDKYGSLDTLNARWGTVFWSQSYTDWNQIDLPRKTLAFHNPSFVLDHRRFISDSATSFLESQVSILRTKTQNQWITHNGLFSGIDYYRFTQSLDLFAQDNYPTFLAEPRFPTAALLTACRGFNGRMMVMEQLTGPCGQTYMLRTPEPGQMKFYAMQAVAHGADGIIHFRWRGARHGAEQYWAGVVDQDDRLGPRYDEFREEGRELATVGKAVFGSAVRSDIAIINDFEAEWAYDHQYFTKEVNRDAGVHFRADLVDVFTGVSASGFNADFIPPTADFSKYRLILAPRLLMTDPALQARIRAFVGNGGVFIAGAHSSVKDRDNVVTAGPKPAGLTDLFGIEVALTQCYDPPSKEKNAATFGRKSSLHVNVLAESLKPLPGTGARPLASWESDFFKGSPACTERPVGRGKAVYYGSFLDADSTRRFVGDYADELRLARRIRGPAEVEVVRRSTAEKEFYFLLNHGTAEAVIDLGPGFHNIITNQPAGATERIRPFGYLVLATRSESSPAGAR